MGGMLAIIQQAEHRSFERLAIAGWSNIGVRFGADDATVSAAVASDAYLPAPRALMRALFFLPSVADDLVELDAQLASLTPAPLGRLALTPDAVASEAARVDCPVLLAFGEIDTSAAPDEEPRHFRAAPQVTLIRIPASAHMHHYASSRREFWDRLDTWLQS